MKYISLSWACFYLLIFYFLLYLMGRPKIDRIVCSLPTCVSFLPSKKTIKGSCETIYMDELEAIRLADMEGIKMNDASKKMGVSAPTFCRILAEGRKKIGRALFSGKAINICVCEGKNNQL